jgi:hypothetical protein
MRISIYVFIIIFISCHTNKDKTVEKISNDTIDIPKNIALEKHCQEQTKGYKNKYGIIFSNYYRDEPQSLDFDNNKTADTIVVLKPYYENSIDGCYSADSDSDFPFLVVSKTIDNKSIFFRIYKNALTINGENYYEEVYIKNNGFIISKDYNGNNGFFSKTFISFKKNNFYVDSISVDSWGRHQYKKTFKFKYKTFLLSKYKRTDIDSIRNVLDKSSL